ncbi:hypothetical protein NLM27_43075 [Bradyrhizobium sp. CCGB12]|uniref:hypothetical protein n=1 Tax=Bradyrhizobium sp. CCGB12 TaxID=2949632 RepID=UPI0020B2369E|nr:hypothetical protein [Bradyrhizobium sp. CCGB12]MCP3395481.1 hypothetical protein [Bradyrhizobium sp. CCGB12]
MLRLTLRELFEHAELWRSMGPYHARRSEAAEIFRRLTETAAFVDEDVLWAYAELWEGEADRQAHSRLLRTVGFGFTPESASEFVAHFIAERTGGFRGRDLKTRVGK